MRPPRRTLSLSLATGFLAGGLSLAGPPAAAQVVSADYTLVAPAWLAEVDPDPPARAALPLWGPLRLGAVGTASGSGLSLEAGEKWFARAGVGRSLESDVLSVGGGYRFPGGHAFSMHVTRQFGQHGLGLAARYDWHRSYLRLGYESPLPAQGLPDRLRFSAGLRF